LDAVFIGEADDVIDELVRFLAKAKQQCADRRETLSELAKVFPGIYVPALRNTAKEHHVIRESIFYPTKFIVPNVEAVQERAVVELARGCTRVAISVMPAPTTDP